MMINIRPHHVFEIINKPFSYVMLKVLMPNIYSPLLLETAILVTLSKFVKAKKIFEFGTYLGIQTLNLIMNMPSSSRIWTIDFDRKSFKKAVQLKHDIPYSKFHFKNINKLAFINTPYQKRVITLKGDSNQFNYSNYKNAFDMIYIDGGHDRRTLNSDTNYAFKILNKDIPSCIAWHDYQASNYPKLTDYIDRLAAKYRIFYVQETHICFYLNKADI